MTTILVAFILAFLVSVVATRIVIYLAWRWGVLDKPDGYRKGHARTTPRLGGLAIYVAFVTPILALLLLPGVSTVSGVLSEHLSRIVGLLVCSTMILALGAMDDVFDLRPRWKLLWQIVVASVMCVFGFTIEGFGNPFGGSSDLGALAFPVTVFWFVACMNAVNLLDGIDGLAAGTSVFVGLTIFLVSLLFSNVLGMFLMACLTGAALGFLVFNFPPARIFPGDSGSLLLGFLIAALSLIGATMKASTAVALFIPIVALGLPIFDTALAIVRRWYRRLPLSSPDQEHVHHVLVSMGYSPRRAVLILYLTCVVLGGAALLITVGRSRIFIFVVGALAILVFICIRIFSTMRFGNVLARIVEDRTRRERSGVARVEIERIASAMRRSADMDALWALCGEGFHALGLDQATLERLADGKVMKVEWADANGKQNGVRDQVPPSNGLTPVDCWTMRLGLRDEGVLIGALDVRVNQASGSASLDMAELLEHLASDMARHLRRLDPSIRQPR